MLLDVPHRVSRLGASARSRRPDAESISSGTLGSTAAICTSCPDMSGTCGINIDPTDGSTPVAAAPVTRSAKLSYWYSFRGNSHNYALPGSYSSLTARTCLRPMVLW